MASQAYIPVVTRNKVQRLLRERELTHAQIATMCGVSVRYVYGQMRGLKHESGGDELHAVRRIGTPDRAEPPGTLARAAAASLIGQAERLLEAAERLLRGARDDERRIGAAHPDEPEDALWRCLDAARQGTIEYYREIEGYNLDPLASWGGGRGRRKKGGELERAD